MVDITPITDAILSLSAAAITAFGGIAINRLVVWMNIKNGDAARNSLDEVLDKAVTFGLGQAQAIIKAEGWDHPAVRSATLNVALPYLIDRFPDVLRASKLDPASPDTERKMKDALLRAFPRAALAASNSPATPPVTAPNPPVQAALEPHAAMAAIAG